MFRVPPPYLWTPLSPQRVKGCSPLTIPMWKSKRKKASRCAKTGCGAQRPLRALSGTRVLLTAAPTAPPCIRRRRRSSLLRIFCASPIYGSAEDFTFLLDVTVSREVTPAAKQQVGETRKKRLAKRLAFFRFDNSSGIIKGEQPLIRASRASKVAGAFLVLFWHAKENLTLPQPRFTPRNKRAISFPFFYTLRFASDVTLSIYLPPAQYSAAPHPRATRPGYVPPAPDSSGGCGPAFHELPASGR